MIRLIRIEELPPGGLPYVQPETGKKFLGMVSFSEQVRNITEYRRGAGLPGADTDTATIDLHAYTCNRLGNDPRFCSDGPVITSQKKTTGVPHAVGAALAGAVTQVKQLDAGRKILMDWLGDGAEPVPSTQAQARSDVCTGRLSGNPCPANKKSGWSIPMAVAATIQKQVEKKNQMNLTVEGDEELGMCVACGCKLSLKIFVPFPHIYKHTSDEQFRKFAEHNPKCWVIAERAKMNGSPA